MSGAQLLLKCLETDGVEFIFGIPGVENLHARDDLPDSTHRAVGRDALVRCSFFRS